MRIPKRIAARVKGAWEPTAIPKIYSTPAALSVRAKASPPVIFAIVEPPLPCIERLARHGLRVLTSIALTFASLSKRWQAVWRGRRSYPLYHWAWGLGAWLRKNQGVGRCMPIDPQGLGILQCLPIRGRPCLQGSDVVHPQPFPILYRRQHAHRPYYGSPASVLAGCGTGAGRLYCRGSCPTFGDRPRQQDRY